MVLGQLLLQRRRQQQLLLRIVRPELSIYEVIDPGIYSLRRHKEPVGRYGVTAGRAGRCRHVEPYEQQRVSVADGRGLVWEVGKGRIVYQVREWVYPVVFGPEEQYL